jgi:hypothetical protein
MKQTSVNKQPCQYCNYMTNSFAYIVWNCKPLYVCVYCAEMMDIMSLELTGHFANRVNDGN